MANPESYKLYGYLIGLVFFLCIEFLFSARKSFHAKSKRVAIHLVNALFNTLILKIIFLWFPLSKLIEWCQFHKIGIINIFGANGLAELLATLLAFDYFTYWWHRWNHRLPFLWRFHKVHHSDIEVDVSNSMRFHFGELLLSLLFRTSCVLLWGPSFSSLIIYEILLSFSAQFHHCNIVLPSNFDQKLAHFFVTPLFHTGHHTVTERTGNANFTSLLSVWDKLHKTFVFPRRDELTVLGIPEDDDLARANHLHLKWIFLRPFWKVGPIKNALHDVGNKETD